MEIRAADLEKDRTALIQVLREHLTAGSNDRRFDWLYLRNPDGEARAWIAEDRGDVVGAAAVFPRRVYYEGRVQLGSVLGDFCLAPRLRVMGPAIQLFRACLKAIQPAWVAVAFDFPSASLNAVYGRLKIPQHGRLVRLVRPLRGDHLLGDRLSNPILTKAAAAVSGLALRALDLTARPARGVEVATLEGRCGDEFTTLAAEHQAAYGNGVHRSAAYLNWRFGDNPYSDFEMLTARRGARLVGYAVLRRDGEHATIMDLFGAREPGIARSLVARIVSRERARGAATIHVHMVPTHPDYPVMRRLGFLPRESAPIVLFAPSSEGGVAADTAGLRAWCLVEGDRDS